MLSDCQLPPNKAFDGGRTCVRCGYFGAFSEGRAICDRCAVNACSLCLALDMAAQLNGFKRATPFALNTAMAAVDVPAWLAKLIADELMRRAISGEGTLESEVR